MDDTLSMRRAQAMRDAGAEDGRTDEATPRSAVELVPDRNRDSLGSERRIMRNVQVVAEKELKRVRPRREFQSHLRLTLSEMTIVIARGNRQIGRREFGVDDQMMMARVLFCDAGWCHPHARKTETDHQG